MSAAADARANSVVIRQPSPSDRAAIKSINDQLLEVKYEDAFYDSLFAYSTDMVTVCAYAGSVVIGVATARTNDAEGASLGDRLLAWLRPPSRTGYISTLGVLPAYRRRGIAQLLLHRLCGALVSRHCAEVSLHCLSTNVAAQTLYAASGFKRVDYIRQHYYFDERFHDAVYMRKRLITPSCTTCGQQFDESEDRSTCSACSTQAAADDHAGIAGWALSVVWTVAAHFRSPASILRLIGGSIAPHRMTSESSKKDDDRLADRGDDALESDGVVMTRSGSGNNGFERMGVVAVEVNVTTDAPFCTDMRTTETDTDGGDGLVRCGPQSTAERGSKPCSSPSSDHEAICALDSVTSSS